MESYTITAKKTQKNIKVHCICVNNVTTFAVHGAKTVYQMTGRLSEGDNIYGLNIILSKRVESVNSLDELNLIYRNQL